jgi:hypothetical protein
MSENSTIPKFMGHLRPLILSGVWPKRLCILRLRLRLRPLRSFLLHLVLIRAGNRWKDNGRGFFITHLD